MVGKAGMSINRPVMRYHGGKWRIASWIISHFPIHETYVEPFLGAASVLLQKPSSRVEVGNDLYGRVVNLFRVIRDPETAVDLQRRLRLTLYSSCEYYSAREISGDSVEDARRMIVLGYQSHGSTGSAGGKLSGWRRGVRDHGHTSAMDWHSIWECVLAWSDRLRGVFIEQDDAITVMERWDSPNTLFYVDPPYVAETRKAGPRGYRHEFTEKDHKRLAEFLQSAQGSVVLSGYDSEMYRELYGKWEKHSIPSVADAGSRSVECLWIKGNGQNKQMCLFEHDERNER